MTMSSVPLNPHEHQGARIAILNHNGNTFVSLQGEQFWDDMVDFQSYLDDEDWAKKRHSPDPEANWWPKHQYERLMGHAESAFRRSIELYPSEMDDDELLWNLEDSLQAVLAGKSSLAANLIQQILDSFTGYRLHKAAKPNQTSSKSNET